MYSVSPVYGDIPFDQKYLPTCLYPMKPYYEMDCNESECSVGMMDCSLPELLPSFEGLDLNDTNNKNALEDILSRQMMLICRLNELEQKLTTCTTGSTTESIPVPPPSLSLLSSKQHEDITVHFDFDHIPYTLFTVINCLVKSSIKVLTNLHLQSSVVNDYGIGEKVSNLKQQLKKKINFSFTDHTEFGSRSEFSLIVTFIVKRQPTSCFGIFNSKQGPIQGELNLARKLVETVVSPTSESESRLWSFLQNEQLLRSDKACLEQLGPLFSSIASSSGFNQSSSLVEAVLWSLASFDRSVARSLRSLFPENWQNSIQKFVTR